MKLAVGRRRNLTFLILIFISLIGLILTGCTKEQEEQRIVNESPDSPSVIAPSVQVEEKYYRGLAPFKSSKTRGTLLTRTTLEEYRLDADRLELALLDVAQDYFPIEDHLFNEGQFIEKEELFDWLRIRSEKNKEGLNPPEADERILRHILEHNYTDFKGELKGAVIGLSLASTYSVTKEDGTKNTMVYTDDELRNYGTEMAAQLVPRLRDKIKKVPIVVVLYRLEDRHSLVPGNVLSVGYTKQGQSDVDEWEAIEELYFLLPSQALSNHNKELANNFSDFHSKVKEFYPNYVGIVGVSRFIDGKLVELTFNVTTEFASKTEVIQLTQFFRRDGHRCFS